MKFVYPDIDHVFDTAGDKINTLIIENPNLFVRLLSDIRGQLDGEDGKSVLSDANNMLSIGKYAELLTEFVPFRLNTKPLLSKIGAAFEKRAAEEEHYLQSLELLSEIEKFFYNLSQDFCVDVGFAKIGIPSLIKAAGIEINEEYPSLAEKILDYFELVTEFDSKKLFITVNLRNYLCDEETEKMLDSSLQHGYYILMIEGCEHTRLRNERRYIVDPSLCEIC